MTPRVVQPDDLIPKALTLAFQSLIMARECQVEHDLEGVIVPNRTMILEQLESIEELAAMIRADLPTDHPRPFLPEITRMQRWGKA